MSVRAAPSFVGRDELDETSDPFPCPGLRRRSLVEAGESLGDYHIVALLGEGAMAHVHLAVKHGREGFRKLLVVKSMRDELADPIYKRAFMHEARLAAQLNHANLVHTYEVGEDDCHLFIAMEYAEGQTLRSLRSKLAPKRLPLAMELRILAELARGLHHAHALTGFDGSSMEIVHRDISPQNVMLTYDGQVKLLDFGVAKAKGSGDLTAEGMIKGKIDYMAPEQLRGEAVDQRADVFALGVMLWEALTGMPFSGGENVPEITKMHNRIMGREKKLKNAAPGIPDRLKELCERAIAVDAKDRLPSAEAFEQGISAYLADADERPSALALAEVMEGAFAVERTQMREKIDALLRTLAETEEREANAPSALSGGPPRASRTGFSSIDVGIALVIGLAVAAVYFFASYSATPRARDEATPRAAPSSIAHPRAPASTGVAEDVFLQGEASPPPALEPSREQVAEGRQERRSILRAQAEALTAPVPAEAPPAPGTDPVAEAPAEAPAHDVETWTHAPEIPESESAPAYRAPPILSNNPYED